MSSANSRNLEGIIFRDLYFTCNGFYDEFNIMILFNNEYVSVLRRKPKGWMRSVSWRLPVLLMKQAECFHQRE